MTRAIAFTRRNDAPRTVQDCCEMEMEEAFRLCLERLNETPRPWPNEFKTALGLVTAFYLLKVKG